MKLIDKYLLREYLTTLFYCLSGFCMLFVLADLFARFGRFLSAGTSAAVVLRYYLYFLATRAEQVVPASILLSTLYTLWQLTRNNELTAMRAGGIGLHRIILPFLAVGLLFTVMNIVIKELVAPRAAFQLADFFEDRPGEGGGRIITLKYMNAEDFREWTIDEFDFNSPTLLKGVHITQERENGTIARKITAHRAEWIDNCWWLRKAVVHEYGESDNPVGGPKPLGPKVAMPDLSELPSDFANEVKPWEFLSSREMKRYLALHPRLSDDTAARRRFQLYSRRAMPWACLIVTLFAIPAGATTGRQSALTGIFLAMAFFFGFYALDRIGMFLSIKQVVSPVLGAWLSNTVFLVAGLVMLTKLER